MHRRMEGGLLSISGRSFAAVIAVVVVVKIDSDICRSFGNYLNLKVLKKCVDNYAIR